MHAEHYTYSPIKAARSQASRGQAISNYGIGKKLVAFLLEKAADLKLEKVFLLTTQTADWFLEHGFTEGNIDDLPSRKRPPTTRRGIRWFWFMI